MASELYESRLAAFRKNDFLLVPEVPKPTLSAILRGRIEEIAGWTLYQQGNYPDAIVRLRGALSRSCRIRVRGGGRVCGVWERHSRRTVRIPRRLNFYIESYKTDKPDFAKYAVVESLYRKINGTIDGLEAKIGPERVAILQLTPEVKPSPAPSETPAASTTRR